MAVFGCEISSAFATITSARALRAVRVDFSVKAPVANDGGSLRVPRLSALCAALWTSAVNESGGSSSPNQRSRVVWIY